MALFPQDLRIELPLAKLMMANWSVAHHCLQVTTLALW